VSYQFRRLDTDEIIEVDFQTMMEKDVAGFLKVEIGGQQVECREVRGSTGNPCQLERPIGPPPKVVNSLALGFMEGQLDEYEEDRKRNGFHGIEFERNPQDPRFFQVVASSRDEMNRYAAHYGLYDKGERNGSAVGITAKELEEARVKAIEKYGKARK
jgi:hypothetical protein